MLGKLRREKWEQESGKKLKKNFFSFSVFSKLIIQTGKWKWNKVIRYFFKSHLSFWTCLFKVCPLIGVIKWPEKWTTVSLNLMCTPLNLMLTQPHSQLQPRLLKQTVAYSEKSVAWNFPSINSSSYGFYYAFGTWYLCPLLAYHKMLSVYQDGVLVQENYTVNVKMFCEVQKDVSAFNKMWEALFWRGDRNLDMKIFTKAFFHLILANWERVFGQYIFKMIGDWFFSSIKNTLRSSVKDKFDIEDVKSRHHLFIR